MELYRKSTKSHSLTVYSEREKEKERKRYIAARISSVNNQVISMLKQLKQLVILMPAKLYVDRIKMSKLYEIYSNFCSRYRHLQPPRCTSSLMAFDARIHVVFIFEQCPTTFTKSITGVLKRSLAHRHARALALYFRHFTISISA